MRMATVATIVPEKMMDLSKQANDSRSGPFIQMQSCNQKAFWPSTSKCRVTADEQDIPKVSTLHMRSQGALTSVMPCSGSISHATHQGLKGKGEVDVMKRAPLGGDKFVLYNATSKYTKKNLTGFYRKVTVIDCKMMAKYLA